MKRVGLESYKVLKHLVETLIQPILYFNHFFLLRNVFIKLFSNIPLPDFSTTSERHSYNCHCARKKRRWHRKHCFEWYHQHRWYTMHIFMHVNSQVCSSNDIYCGLRMYSLFAYITFILLYWSLLKITVVKNASWPSTASLMMTLANQMQGVC